MNSRGTSKVGTLQIGTEQQQHPRAKPKAHRCQQENKLIIKEDRFFVALEV